MQNIDPQAGCTAVQWHRKVTYDLLVYRRKGRYKKILICPECHQPAKEARGLKGTYRHDQRRQLLAITDLDLGNAGRRTTDTRHCLIATALKRQYDLPPSHVDVGCDDLKMCGTIWQISKVGQEMVSHYLGGRLVYPAIIELRIKPNQDKDKGWEPAMRRRPVPIAETRRLGELWR